jgi:formiminotetrahydrofolate cyclodeaminase
MHDTHILGALVSDILQLSVGEFIRQTAAKQPTPGGGSVAALCGALAASLAAMALEYTVGKKAFAAHDAEIRDTLSQFQRASEMLRELMLEDVAAYEALNGLLKLPEPERRAKPEYLPAVAAAIRAPQTTAGFALSVLEKCHAMLEKTNKMLLSDLGIAAVYAHATVHASEMNVRVNLPLLPGGATGEEAEATRKEMVALCAKADGVYATVRGEILRRV